MTFEPTEQLIDRLAGAAPAVRPLRPPLRRAALAGGALLLGVGLLVWWLGDMGQLGARYQRREAMMALELAAMAATGLTAIAAAFSLAVPGGGSRRWLLAPLPPACLWLTLAGMTCWSDLQQRGARHWQYDHSIDCLLFIAGVGTILGLPLFWRLSRARPLDPLPVAALGALGTTSLAAAMLHFFHPFAVTFPDLAVHVAAILLVIASAALLRRTALRPA